MEVAGTSMILSSEVLKPSTWDQLEQNNSTVQKRRSVAISTIFEDRQGICSWASLTFRYISSPISKDQHVGAHHHGAIIFADLIINLSSLGGLNLQWPTIDLTIDLTIDPPLAYPKGAASKTE